MADIHAQLNQVCKETFRNYGLTDVEPQMKWSFHFAWDIEETEANLTKVKEVFVDWATDVATTLLRLRSERVPRAISLKTVIFYPCFWCESEEPEVLDQNWEKLDGPEQLKVWIGIHKAKKPDYALFVWMERGENGSNYAPKPRNYTRLLENALRER